MSQNDGFRPAQRRKGRSMYMTFEFFNTLSFTLLAGNIIVLLLMRFGASSIVLGIIQAMPYVAFLFMPLAKPLVPRWGLVRTFGIAWTGRYITIAPIVAAPLLVVAGYQDLGIALVFGGFMLFQFTRGMGLVSISPLTQAVSEGKDRGAWLSMKNMVVYASSLVAGLAISLGLGKAAPLEGYALFMGIGMVLGLVGCTFIFRIPEPPGAAREASRPFLADVRAIVADRAFARFIPAFALFYLVAGMGRSFFVVYAKKLAGFSDDSAMLLTVIAGLGAVAVGWFSRLSLDRLGARPLFMAFNGLFLLAALALAIAPPLSGDIDWVVLTGVFFLGTFGGVGAENASQAYFMGICRKRYQFNGGMLYYLILGLSGGIGSLLGGTLLQFLEANLKNPGQVWQIYYAITAVLGMGSFVLQLRMDSVGGRSFSFALGSMVSPSSLKALRNLQALDRAHSRRSEEAALRRLAGSRSSLAVEELLKRLESPVFTIRNRALAALEHLVRHPHVEEALMRHVAEHQFATAWRAATILGRHGSSRCLPALRTAITSDDYALAASAVLSLGQLHDRDSRAAVESALKVSHNTLFMVHAIAALKHFGQTASIGPLLELFERDDLPLAVRDEAVFGLAGLLGQEDWLYPRYLAFLEDHQSGVDLLVDDLLDANLDATVDPRLAILHRLCQACAGDDADFVGDFHAAAGDTVELGLLDQDLVGMLEATMVRSRISELPRLRFFAVALIVYAHTGRRHPDMVGSIGTGILA